MAILAEMISASPSETSAYSCAEFDASLGSGRAGRFFFSVGRWVGIAAAYFFSIKTKP